MTSLAELRRRKVWTQADLAKAADVAPSTVHLIERGKGEYRPRFKVIRELSKALGVDPLDVDEFRPVLAPQSDQAS